MEPNPYHAPKQGGHGEQSDSGGPWNSDRATQLLTEIRDLQRESIALQREAVDRQRRAVALYQRVVVFGAVVVLFLVAVMGFLLFSLIEPVPLPTP